jgi:hypothetical protein
MEAKIVEEKAEARAVHPTPQRASPVTAPEPEPDGEEQIFEDSNVFGVVGRTPSTEELLQVESPSTLVAQIDLNFLGFNKTQRLSPAHPSPPQRRSSNLGFLAVQVHVGHHPGGRESCGCFLIFSQRVLAENGIGSSRIDGSVSNLLRLSFLAPSPASDMWQGSPESHRRHERYGEWRSRCVSPHHKSLRVTPSPFPLH